MINFEIYRDKTKSHVSLGIYIDEGSGDAVFGFEDNECVAGFLTLNADDGKLYLHKVVNKNLGLTLDDNDYLEIVYD